MANIQLRLLQKNKESNTLIIPSGEGNIDLMKSLLRRGKDPNMRDKRGRTALHIAAARGKEEATKLLLDGGADVAATDCVGNTPLHYCGHVETIRCLLNYGAEVIARNHHGDTPLKLMKRRGVEEAAISLIEELQSEEEEDEAVVEQAETTETVIQEAAVVQPLLIHRRRTSQYQLKQKQRQMSRIRSVWYEFCMDLGAERLVLVLLIILCLSLYVAYMVTGLTKHIDTRIPVDVDV